MSRSAAWSAIADAAYPLKVELDGSSITISESTIPTVQATLVITAPSEAATLAHLKVDDTGFAGAAVLHRVALTGTVQGKTRTFDLLLTAATDPDLTGRMTLTLASDDALPGLVSVRDYLDAGDATTGLAGHGPQLRSIINWALSNMPGTPALAAGTADANMTPRYELENLCVDPQAANVGSWVAPGITFASVTGTDHTGASGKWVTAKNSSGSAGDLTASVPLTTKGTPTTTHTLASAPRGSNIYASDPYGIPYVWFSVWVRTPAARTVSLLIQYRDVNGVAVTGSWQAFSVAANTWTHLSVLTSQWDRATNTGGIADFFNAFVKVTGAAANEVLNIDEISVYAVDEFEWLETNPPFIAGDKAQDANYTYQWTGTVGASTSRRIPLDPLDPQSLIQQRGETWKDFLEPLTDAAALRLICDETRTWKLVDPATYTSGPTLALTGILSPGPQRTVDQTDAGSFARGAIARYKWTDKAGRTFIETESQPPGLEPRTVFPIAVVDYDRPYPGSGAAAFLLSRIQQLGTPVEVTATTDLAANAYLPVTIPGYQAGAVINAVVFDLGQDEMRLTIRNAHRSAA
ncbi:hypothetical protein [Gryllotalpicola koreensis]|uniref:CBM-cenC domain-containing protein n=1 Tax=Gryllotalpicola koreensis TaxID=993086 RepID=A0ABP7ZUH6_9MICO